MGRSAISQWVKDPAIVPHAVSKINEVARISEVIAFKSPLFRSAEVDRSHNGNCSQALLMERFTCRGGLLVPSVCTGQSKGGICLHSERNFAVDTAERVH